MTNRIMKLAGTTTLAAALSFSAALSAGAQQTDARWQAWVGCWQPAANGLAAAGSTTLCVSPARSGAAIEVATIDSGVVKTRDTIDASGTLRTIDRDGCKGTEQGEWSNDSRRVFRHVELTCNGGLKRVANTITSITPGGEWLDVQSVNVNGASAVRASHYFPVGAAATTSLPTEFKNVGADMGLAVASARTSAAGALNIESLVEAVHSTDTLAVQTWVIERGAAFTNLDSKMLVRLANAGVPAAVTDVMIGASYPDHFALKAAPTGYDGFSAVDSARIANRARCEYGIAAMWSALYEPECGSLYSQYRTRYGSRYGYNDFLYGYGSPYSLLGYGYPYGSGLAYGGIYGGYYGVPIVQVKGNEPAPHGRVVNGRGYSCGSCSTAGSGSSSATRSGASVDRSGGYTSGSSTSSAPASSSTSSGSSGSTSSSSGDAGRTAHPRPPQR